jgi:hypothetical protein
MAKRTPTAKTGPTGSICGLGDMWPFSTNKTHTLTVKVPDFEHVADKIYSDESHAGERGLVWRAFVKKMQFTNTLGLFLIGRLWCMISTIWYNFRRRRR